MRATRIVVCNPARCAGLNRQTPDSARETTPRMGSSATAETSTAECRLSSAGRFAVCPTAQPNAGAEPRARKETRDALWGVEAPGWQGATTENTQREKQRRQAGWTGGPNASGVSFQSLTLVTAKIAKADRRL